MKNKYISWIIVILIIFVLFSPVLTYQGAIEAAHNASREYTGSALQNYGYVAREFCYLLFAILGIRIVLKQQTGVLFLLALGVFIVIILLKDNYIYGDLSWSIFGIRPILILFSFPVMGNIFYNRKPSYKNALVIAVKTIIIILVPVTLFQLKELPPLFGATFVGPRTMGFWPNPIIYSICLASFALFLWVVKARNAFLWTMICFALAITTGGRAGLLALLLLGTMHLIHLSGIRRLEVRSRLALYFVTSCIIAVMIPLLFIGLSSPSISGRIDTEGKAFNDGRVSIIKNVFEEISSDGYLSIFFGHRLGEGTNAVNTITSITQVSDNLFLMIFRSYGLIGLVLFITLILLWLGRSYSNPRSIMIILASLPMISSQSIIEIHPAGLLLVICASIAMPESKGKYQNQKANIRITRSLYSPINNISNA